MESASSYQILSSSGCITLEGVDDGDRFKAIQEAFSVVGVEKDAQMQVFLIDSVACWYDRGLMYSTVTTGRLLLFYRI